MKNIPIFIYDVVYKVSSYSYQLSIEFMMRTEFELLEKFKLDDHLKNLPKHAIKTVLLSVSRKKH